MHGWRLPRQFFTIAAVAAVGCCAIGTRVPLHAQSALGHSPNIRGGWTLDPGRLALTIAHRFEFISGGDQLLNIPTLGAGLGLGGRVAVGLDFTSNSEIVPARTGGNETQFWVGAPLTRAGGLAVELLAAYNTAARSFDGAVTGHVGLGPFAVHGELRGFQDALGTGAAGGAAAIGASWRLTPRLELAADAGRMLRPDSLDTIWSAGVAVAIPGSPHTLSLHATNGGATTLQGASRPKVIGSERVRLGFLFTIPLGSGRQWAGIFRRDPPATADSTAAAQVLVRMIALQPREVRIRAGQAVEWINQDPLAHTITADDGSWDSGELTVGQRYVRVFTRPGRYTYHCRPHPQMTGVVIVE